jgi:nitroreductase
MELESAIKGRRSVRRFKPDPIPKAVLERIIDMAQWAPSAMNLQDRLLVVVQGDKKAELTKIAAGAFEAFRPNLEASFKDKPKIIEATKTFLETLGGAPVIILAYGGKFPSGEADTLSITLAVQNLLLSAFESGLGTVWADAAVFYKEKEINALVGIEGRKLVCLIPIGYPAEEPKAPPRKNDRVLWAGF